MSARAQFFTEVNVVLLLLEPRDGAKGSMTKTLAMLYHTSRTKASRTEPDDKPSPVAHVVPPGHCLHEHRLSLIAHCLWHE
jgi:hypothetical protein